MIRGFFRWLLTLILLAGLALVLVIGGRFWAFTQSLYTFDPPRHIVVSAGERMKDLARRLDETHDTGESWQWVLLAKIKNADRRIKAGEYVLAGAMTPAEILDKMVRGEVLLQEVRIPEGATFKAIRTALEKNPLLADTTSAFSANQIAEQLGMGNAYTPNALEGMFFPDTYRVLRHTPTLEVFKMAFNAQQKALSEAWANRAPDLPLHSPYEALILASIVEKETAQANDRGLVASVFINRLRVQMPLQSDPTVIYGLGEAFNGNLTRAHLQSAHAYNTYTLAALPPTPIASVSAASLMAVLHPPTTRYYYFVARGDGSSQFSQTLAEHNKAVDYYQRRRNAP